jgi:tetratricopeptide (TPR) repeat protein
VQDISKEMGVRYVLEGSIRKTDDQLRIAVELIDATIDHPLWAEQYDRPLKNLFVVQDEIVHRIVTTLNLQLTVREQGFIVRRHTNNLEAYDVFLRGMELHLHFTKETTAQARQMFEKVLTLDPQDAEAYVMLAFTYHNDWILRWSSDSQTLERALALVQQAVAIDDSLPDAHSLLGMIYTLKQQYDQAIAEGEQAIALDPNEGDSYGMQAQTLVYAGRGEQAIHMAQRAMRLNPRYPVWYSFELGWAYRVTGQYAESVAALQEAIRQNPKYLPAHLQLAFTYLMQWAFQESMDEQILDQALAEVQRSLTFSDALPSGHEFLGQIYLWQKQYERAIAEMEQSIILDPNEARSYAVLAETLSRVGRSEEAVRMVEQALRRKPAPMYSHLSSVGLAYYLAGRPEEATAPLKQFLGHYPNILGPHLTLAAAYSELGKDAEARVEATEVLRINPKFSLNVHRERVPIKDPVLLERHIAALRKAGLR